MKNDTLIRKDYMLECLSPVHVGNGNTLKAFEYIYDREREIICFLDESKWVRFLYRHHLTDDFADFLTGMPGGIAGGSPYKGDNVWEWLKKRGISSDEIISLSVRQAKAETRVLGNGNHKGSLNDVACHMTLADGRPYIPGSTIKGALRTAILFHQIQRNPKTKAEFWKRILKADDKVNNYRDLWEYSRIIADLENELLNTLENPVNTRWNQDFMRCTKSRMRGLLIGDAVCTRPLKTVILQKIDASVVKNRYGEREKELPLFRECVPAGASFKFSLALDRTMLQPLGIETPEDLVAMSRDYIQQGMSLLQNIFGVSYPAAFADARAADIFIGGGTGLLTKSLFYSLAPTKEAGRNIVAHFLAAKFAHHAHDIKDRQIAPRTLKLTRTDREKSIMGMCRLQEIVL